MSDPVDFTKVQVGDTIHIGFEVLETLIGAPYPVRLLRYGWANIFQIVGHTPRAPGVGDRVLYQGEEGVLEGIFGKGDDAEGVVKFAEDRELLWLASLTRIEAKEVAA